MLNKLSNNKLNFTDESQFQNVVIWLEDQKIRRYKIEDREELRTVKASAEVWSKAFNQYLIDLDCPLISGSRNEMLDWLLSLGIHFEFSEKPNLYSAKSEAKQELSSANVKTNPLDNLDCKYTVSNCYFKSFNHLIFYFIRNS